MNHFVVVVVVLFGRDPSESQRRVAMISEMIHSASLIHDDVIDQSNFRRGKPSVNVLWNHRKVIKCHFFFFLKCNCIAKLCMRIHGSKMNGTH